MLVDNGKWFCLPLCVCVCGVWVAVAALWSMEHLCFEEVPLGDHSVAILMEWRVDIVVSLRVGPWLG